MKNNDVLKVTSIYMGCIIVAFWLIWVLLDAALPEADLNLLRALSTAFGVNLPDDIFVSTEMGARALAVILIIAVLSIGLIILNVFFGAVVTTHFIRPRIKLLTSSRGVLSTRWNAAMPYVLVRLSNFHSADLVDVRLSIVLTVRERRDTGEEYITHLPVTDFTPPHVLVMIPRQPWSIAVPADALLSNSMTRNYHFAPGDPVTKSFSTGKTAVFVQRKLEILIQGIDVKSYSSFAEHRSVLVDEQDGDVYTLHLHRGAFKDLPLRIEDPADLEKYVD